MKDAAAVREINVIPVEYTGRGIHNEKIKELPPDAFERECETEIIEIPADKNKVKATLGGVIIAGGSAATAGVGAYKTAKGFTTKIIDFIESERSQYAKEAGKVFKAMSDKMKTNIKFGAAIAAGAAALALVFKDSDKDGKLDIIEAVQKFINPD